jgi:lycopene cyclase domain-containing protein
MPEYFLILMVVLAVAAVLHTAYKVRIYTSTAHCIAVNLVALLAITIWDNFAIYRGHWSFGERFLLGPKIVYMPIEEYMFILIFPYFGLVVYKILERHLKRK